MSEEMEKNEESQTHSITRGTGQGMSVDNTASFKRLIEIGIALSAEKNPERLMERILIEAKDMCNADGGTLYIRTEEDTLKFAIMRTDSLNIAQGGTTGKSIALPPVQMYDEDEKANLTNIASYSAITGETINIKNAYDSYSFDFSGPKKFDASTGYRSTSFLTVPLKNRQEEVIGVLQLLNALDTASGEVIAFSSEIEPLVEALASQATVALENQHLIESQKQLLDSFIELLATAVDAKSPYTGGHCQRVPELTVMLTEAVCDTREGKFKKFNLTEEEWYELRVGAWLHDCGKITTPEYVVDKATKLETITDRIHEVRMRFEVMKCEAVIKHQQALLDGKGKKKADREKLEKKLTSQLAKLDDDFAFIAKCNIGGEFMAEEDMERVKKIAKRKWTRTLDDRLGVAMDELKRRQRKPAQKLPRKDSLLDDRVDHIIEHDSVVYTADPDNPFGFKIDAPEHKYNLGEIYNLCIAKGTLTPEERFKINDHIVQTIVMLEQLPFPKHLARVPEIAGGHHEKMDGTGYPKGLKGEEMSVPARVMAIADVFEALTAADRPYKAPKKLSESIRIMSFMVKDSHLDGDLFKLFLESGVYLEYAAKYLEPFQIDDIDIEEFIVA